MSLTDSVRVYDICGNNLTFGGFVKTKPPDDILCGFMYSDSVCSIITFDLVCLFVYVCLCVCVWCVHASVSECVCRCICVGMHDV